jgi:hypothetical protein
LNSGGRPRRSQTGRAGAVSPASSPPGAVLEGDAPHVVARLVRLEPGVYAFSLPAETSWRDPVAGFALPAVQVACVPRPDGAPGVATDGAVEITDSFGRAGSWLGGRHRVLFVTSPSGGGAALVTGYLARDPDNTLLELDIRRIDPPAQVPPLTLRMGGATAAGRLPQPIRLDVVAHIRGRGDVRFQDTPWIGRLGPGLWIEAFMVFPRGRATAIEYKGLTASGSETPWIGGGSLCGSRGQGTPLIGFAVRQKAVPGGEPVDCEYTGYFQSGATAGPSRNGAPCRSAIDNDPLEGLQLRLIPRPPAPETPPETPGSNSPGCAAAAPE